MISEGTLFVLVYCLCGLVPWYTHHVGAIIQKKILRTKKNTQTLKFRLFGKL